MDRTDKVDGKARATVYSFLAGVFSSHPTLESVNGLRQMAETLGQSFLVDASLDELDREFMDLFVVPNPSYVAPYESVFRDQWLLPTTLKRGMNPGEASKTIKGLLMGESTEQVRQAYLEAGLTTTEELPDHISNELRFMAHLWSREANMLDDGASVAAQRVKFRDDHLLKWIGDLRERLSESDRLGLYTTALNIVAAVLRDEADLEQRIADAFSISGLDLTINLVDIISFCSLAHCTLSSL